MDPNLLYWKVHGQSFFSRLKIWADVLDPLLLLSSGGEIQKAHTRLGSGEKLSEQDAHLPNLSLSAVHADSGATLPLPFRPPAFLLMSMPLVLCSSLPHKNVTPALFWQFVLQSYSARFNFIHGNSTSQQKASLNGLLLIAGTVSYTTCAGALPQIIINRLNIRIPSVQNFFRTALPVPLSALLAFANVYTVRSEETDTGIKVYDSNGNQVGFSKAAGVKAVRETALSRAVMFGTTAAFPNLLALLFRKRVPQGSALKAILLRNMGCLFALGLMIPISFSLYPQLGTIKREMVEEELRTAAADGQLYYHRGL
ncbi:sideroflexin-4 isoform X5 [Antennarius striatus]|uniref:sideroflexin-4 isoform X5 n=1 Tax=Antennarius striatus TaxID=241820 RepID=UPI0035B393AE